MRPCVHQGTTLILPGVGQRYWEMAKLVLGGTSTDALEFLHTLGKWRMINLSEQSLP
jgi:hypothetical protein